MRTLMVAAGIMGLVAGSGAMAAGDLSTRTTRLPALQLGSPEDDFAISTAAIELETGKAYRLPITSAGSKEMAWIAPEFFRSIWVREIKVGDLEIHTPVIEHVEFDGEGTIDLYFVPIRSGSFDWEVKGLADRGMKGKINVK